MAALFLAFLVALAPATLALPVTRTHNTVAASLDSHGSTALFREEKKERRTKYLEKKTDTPVQDRSQSQGASLTEFAAVSVDPDAVPDLTVGEEASQIVRSVPPLGLVTLPRLIATANLGLMALSVPGDFVQTGVYTGGTAILMAKVLKNQNSSRLLWAADSFAGLPQENPLEVAREKNFPEAPAHSQTLAGQKLDQQIASQPGWFSSSRLVFEKNLEANGFGNSTTNPQIKVLQGWFNETLPKAPIEQISFLQMDGDIYESTWDTLTSLYDKVIPGGYIYVDDYGSFLRCKHAIDSFRQQHCITEPMYPISECGNCSRFTALWWRKEKTGCSMFDRFSQWIR